MPSTREIRGRIRSVKNIAQITRTMQMVASSRMRRAQERVEQSRPYTEQLRELVSRLANVAVEDIGGEIALLKQRPVRNIGYLLITPDRGLSGALPSNINRRDKRPGNPKEVRGTRRAPRHRLYRRRPQRPRLRITQPLTHAG